MLLSVIVPVYNMAADDKLLYCLKSLTGQTLDPSEYEVIAVDDCSTDSSFDVMKALSEKPGSVLKAVRLPVNHHQGGAKNAGLALARGEWIGFIDADDWVTPDYYKRLIALADETGADMAGCDYSLVDCHTMEPGRIVRNNRKEQAGILTEEKYRSLLTDSGSLVVKVYRREIILGNDGVKAPVSDEEYLERLALIEQDKGRAGVFPEDIFYEDNAVCKTWMLRAKHFEYIEEPLYFYLQHGASTVHTVSAKNMEDRKEAASLMIGEARRQGYFEQYRPELEFAYTVLFYINTLFSVLRADRFPGAYGFVKDLGRKMREAFPDFEKNPYYRERIPEEEKRLIAMQGKSDLRFYLYYRLLWAYRDFRSGRKRQANRR